MVVFFYIFILLVFFILFFPIGLIPLIDTGRNSIKCLMISRQEGSCRSFTGPDQANLAYHSVCLDPVYDVLWRYVPFVCFSIFKRFIVWTDFCLETSESDVYRRQIVMLSSSVFVYIGKVLCSRQYCGAHHVS